MPLFFFHMRTGRGLDADTIGVDLPDLDAARRQALWAVSDLLRDAALTGRPVPGKAFEIADEEERPVLTVLFGAPRDGGRVG